MFRKDDEFMTRILKRGQQTYFKEDVVTCLADETMQKVFTQSEYGNRMVFMEELKQKKDSIWILRMKIMKILNH